MPVALAQPFKLAFNSYRNSSGTGAWNPISVREVVPANAVGVYGVVLSPVTGAVSGASNGGYSGTALTDGLSGPGWQQNFVCGISESGGLQVWSGSTSVGNLIYYVLGYFTDDEAVFLTQPSAKGNIPVTTFTTYDISNESGTDTVLGAILFCTAYQHFFRHPSSTDTNPGFAAGQAWKIVGVNSSKQFQATCGITGPFYVLGYIKKNLVWNINAVNVTPGTAASFQPLTTKPYGAITLYSTRSGTTAGNNLSIRNTAQTTWDPNALCGNRGEMQQLVAAPVEVKIATLTGMTIWEEGYLISPSKTQIDIADETEINDSTTGLTITGTFFAEAGESLDIYVGYSINTATFSSFAITGPATLSLSQVSIDSAAPNNRELRHYVYSNVATSGHYTATLVFTGTPSFTRSILVRRVRNTAGYDTTDTPAYAYTAYASGAGTTPLTTDGVTTGPTGTINASPVLLSSIGWATGGTGFATPAVGTGFTSKLSGWANTTPIITMTSEHTRYASSGAALAATYTNTGTANAGMVAAAAVFIEQPSNPVVTSAPANGTALPGATAAFSVTATGATSYQWYRTPAASSPVYSVTDNFTRANENPLNNGTWTGVGAGNVRISSNTLIATTGGVNGGSRWNTSSHKFSRYQSSEITLGGYNTADDVAALVLCSSSGSGYVAYTDATPRVMIGKLTNGGTPANLATFNSTAFVSGTKIKIVADARSGSTVLKVYFNGALVLSYTDSTSPHLMGQPGIYMMPQNTNTTTITGFTAEDLGTHAIDGATSATYTTGTLSNANNGDGYFCVATAGNTMVTSGIGYSLIVGESNGDGSKIDSAWLYR
jgi:hypothetical protein